MDYWRGFFTALAIVELLGLAYLARAGSAMVTMMAEFGELHRPAAFVIVTSGWYAVTAGLGLAAAAVLADRKSASGRARVVGLAVVCLVAAVVVAFTWYGLYSPIDALAGAIE